MTTKHPEYDAHVYNLTLNARRQHLTDPHTVTDQRSWMDDKRNIVKRQIRALCCEEAAFVEVVKVKRTVAPKVQSYTIRGDKTVYSFNEAVERVMALIEEYGK